MYIGLYAAVYNLFKRLMRFIYPGEIFANTPKINISIDYSFT